ncbi:hypothetical protein [Helicobacter anatolicus]|uniref:hypothetical protein n=1 Tax=Helicobacter anatolicus TaxID=2905874 RepID=UPI001E474907|nr:hypothetical protein [Helicobacter anatolicus]MCE3038851.1 hypothetical protein [Helicobacter anatolicus]
MKYSFTSAQTKHILGKIVKIWLFYIVLSVGIMVGFFVVLKIQISSIGNKSVNEEKKKVFFDKEIAKISERHKRAEFELSIIKSDDIDNSVVKDGIINLLNLIPDQITISYMQINNKSLIIKGVTPSKEVFRYLLQNPLSAIFGRSEVTFYMLSNGWYEFVSQSHTQDLLTTNKMD